MTMNATTMLALRAAALTALALTLPGAAEAETVTRITRISEPHAATTRAVTVYQSTQYEDALERMRARTMAVEDDTPVPPGHKVTTIYKGAKVTTTYITPSAPVSSGPMK